MSFFGVTSVKLDENATTAKPWADNLQDNTMTTIQNPSPKSNPGGISKIKPPKWPSAKWDGRTLVYTVRKSKLSIL